jgi:hypothetical protein
LKKETANTKTDTVVPRPRRGRPPAKKRGRPAAKKDVVTFAAPVEQSSGGDNTYWVATVDNPKRLDPYKAECEDLIELFQMTFQEGEAFKALWRKGQLRIGNGKPGDTLLRNSEKAYHYSGRMVAMES